MKAYYLTYCYNGTLHTVETENVGECLFSLYLATATGEVNGINIRPKL